MKYKKAIKDIMNIIWTKEHKELAKLHFIANNGSVPDRNTKKRMELLRKKMRKNEDFCEKCGVLR